MSKWDVTDQPFEILDDTFFDQMGLRPKHAEKPTTTPQSKVYPKAETSDWYKQGKECPF
jgi:hypothetical protein